MIKAYSYIRFSTVEQAKGQSLERQLALSEKYAEENNLCLDKQLNMKDLGISAYTGKNISNGALGVFIKAIEAGVIEKGTYLLVESLDRLSRQKAREALSQFLSIINKGIIIVTLADNKKYDSEANDMDLMYSLLIMSRAHEESKTKSLRVQAAWSNKHKNIENKKLTAWAPKWVYLSDDRKEFLLHHDRVEIVERIFQWAVDGLGTNLIIQKLESLDIKPWGSIKNNEPKRRIPKRWYVSYIQRILSDRTVLGEFNLKGKSGSHENKIIENYYPKIISEELFYQVQHIRKSKNVRKTGKGAGRKGEFLSNLFSGILYCGYSTENNEGNHKCDGTDEKMSYTNKGEHLTYIQCARIKSGSTGCNVCRKMWRYDHFETSFLTHIKEIDVSILLGTTSKVDTEILEVKNKEEAIQGELAEIKSRIDKIQVSFDEYEIIPKSLIELIRKNEIQQHELEKELVEIQYEFSRLSKVKKDISKTDNDLRMTIDLMKSADRSELLDIRLKLSEIIKQNIDKIVMYSHGKVYSEQYINKLKANLPEDKAQEAFDIIISDQKINKKKPQPFYKVYYKSGLSRLIQTDVKDPTKVFFTVTLRDGKWSEVSAPSFTGKDSINNSDKSN